MLRVLIRIMLMILCRWNAGAFGLGWAIRVWASIRDGLAPTIPTCNSAWVGFWNELWRYHCRRHKHDRTRFQRTPRIAFRARRTSSLGVYVYPRTPFPCWRWREGYGCDGWEEQGRRGYWRLRVEGSRRQRRGVTEGFRIGIGQIARHRQRLPTPTCYDDRPGGPSPSRRGSQPPRARLARHVGVSPLRSSPLRLCCLRVCLRSPVLKMRTRTG
ncbi:hypothetical protein C8F04DRAFT_245800 [Mycena alexandri]|uniref:Uncharacterized protein n=1 Tax=Mycena alexandri TaxID=1745969 RepID=A0AAD6S823_9AGAR|nr:hypothetical protein C8F04DRAFT_245800 [Mycena alexandri]